jgi:hypothetical protein
LFIGRYVKVIDTSNMPPIVDGGSFGHPYFS